MTLLINSAVITAPGTYQYRTISEDEAAVRLRAAAGKWESYIGYEATAAEIERLCGVRPRLSRAARAMEVGDEAIVVRLPYRVDNPAAKAGGGVWPTEWEYGLLTRVA